jgi:hypothetical protein
MIKTLNEILRNVDTTKLVQLRVDSTIAFHIVCNSCKTNQHMDKNSHMIPRNYERNESEQSLSSFPSVMQQFGEFHENFE